MTDGSARAGAFGAVRTGSDYIGAMGILISLVTIALGLFVSDRLLRGMQVRGGVGGYLWTAVVFGLLNFFLGWLIFGVIGVVSLGLGFLLAFITRWIVTAIVLKLAASLTDRLEIDSFRTALLASLIMSAVNSLADAVLR
jgi:putative membrane protein